MMYVPRLTIPDKGNPYYNTKQKGGYSYAITGSPTCEGLNVLSNCSGYAAGRWHEICGDTSMNQLKPVNAEDFIEYADPDLKVGSKPRLGACAVWADGVSGFGHVAIVEQINDDGTIVTSESAWQTSPAFFTKTRKNDGNWGQPSSYRFIGFIYQKEIYEAPAPTVPTLTIKIKDVKKGEKGSHVKVVQTILFGCGYYYGYIDGDAGNLTAEAILKFQKARGLYQDSIFGIKCWQNFLGDNLLT